MDVQCVGGELPDEKTDISVSGGQSDGGGTGELCS